MPPSTALLRPVIPNYLMLRGIRGGVGLGWVEWGRDLGIVVLYHRVVSVFVVLFFPLVCLLAVVHELC